MLFAVLAHEELFDFEAARVPPGDADQERICARAAGDAGRFRIEKKPLLRIADAIGRAGSEQAQSIAVDETVGIFGADGLGEPLLQGEMLAELIAAHAGAEKLCEAIAPAGIRGTIRRRAVSGIARATRLGADAGAL